MVKHQNTYKQRQYVDADLVILCGGLGTRLKEIVPQVPKSLAKIGDQPFLHHLLVYLERWQFKKIILAVGYKRDQIREYIEIIQKTLLNNLEIIEEDIPRGTGGAVKNAAQAITTKNIFVINGDTASNVDFFKFLKFHKKQKAVLSIAVAKAHRRNDVGIVRVNKKWQITSFQEKELGDGAVERLMSVGAYCISKKIIDQNIQKEVCSLERDIFPEMIAQPCFAYYKNHEIWDIGTPERYRDAPENVQKILYHLS